eukprot:GHVN01077622.1.p1 GENE.GHVN01077622.1~~GHVN01077622.1.p1  ORF type:complete len:164 (-),score=32.99 GHVN01077622.1:734-1183(-)
MSHIVNLPSVCSATEPDSSKYTTKDKGVIQLKFPKLKKDNAIVLTNSSPLSDSSSPGSATSLQPSPHSGSGDNAPLIGGPTEAAPHERYYPGMEYGEREDPPEIKHLPLEGETRSPQQTALQPPVQTQAKPSIPHMTEWEMKRARFEEF